MRRITILEPFLLFGLIIAYIWKLRFAHPISWIVIPILMFLSHLFRHESPGEIGFATRNWRNGLSQLAPALVLTIVLLVSEGFLLHTFRQINDLTPAMDMAGRSCRRSSHSGRARGLTPARTSQRSIRWARFRC